MKKMNTALAFLAALGSIGAAELPEGYREVAYVKGDGTAYIDLGTPLTQLDSVEIVFKIDNEEKAEIFGAREGASAKSLMLGINKDGKNNPMTFDFNNSNYVSTRCSVNYVNGSAGSLAGIKLKGVCNKDLRAFYNFDTEFEYGEQTTRCGDTFTTPKNACLFWANDAWNGPNGEDYKFTGKIYSLVVQTNGVDRIHLVPCVKTTGNFEVGFYDTARNQFYVNAAGSGGLSTDLLSVDPVQATIEIDYKGEEAHPPVTVRDIATGAVLAEGTDYSLTYNQHMDNEDPTIGPATVTIAGIGTYAGSEQIKKSYEVVYSLLTEASWIPTEYTRLAYVQGDGIAYIDLGMKLGNTDSVTMDFRYTDFDSPAMLYGSRESGSANNFSAGEQHPVAGMYRLYADFCNGTSGRVTQDISISNATFRIVSGPYYRTISNRNDRTGWASTDDMHSNNFTTPDNAYLFWCSHNQIAGAGKFTGRILLFQVAEAGSGKLTMKLVPCRNAQGEVGFYDTVGNRFLGNCAESGEFIAGPDMTTERSRFAVMSVPAQAFSGSALEPKVSVTNEVDGVMLVEGVDYTVVYRDNTARGEGTATITGIGAYAGEEAFARFLITGVWYVTPEGDPNSLGVSWSSATSLSNALCSANAGDEVWVKEGRYTERCYYEIFNAISILGGFKGTETGAAERPAEITYSILDGTGSARTTVMGFPAPIGKQVVRLDRLEISEGRCRGLYVSQAAEVVMSNCRIAFNGKQETGERVGRGCVIKNCGSTVITNCIFEGNVIPRNASGVQAGAGLCVQNSGSTRISDSLFLTNGIPIGTIGDTKMGARDYGGAMAAVNTPLVCERTRFLGNGARVSEGTLHCGTPGLALVSVPEGCVVRDCLFFGNVSRFAEDGERLENSKDGGALYIHTGSASSAVMVDGCTFAWNVCGASLTNTYAAALGVHQGRVSVTNSVFWGNVVRTNRDGEYDAAGDVWVGAANAAALKISSSRMGGTNGCYIVSDGGAVTIGEGMKIGPVKFRTKDAKIERLFTGGAEWSFPQSPCAIDFDLSNGNPDLLRFDFSLAKPGFTISFK